VLEIGGGPGNMTARLAEQGADVQTVEVDTALATRLKERFAATPNVEIIKADFLKVRIDELARSRKREKIQVLGNLPYYITSPCLLHLFAYHEWIEIMVLMVQWEVAKRVVAKPGSADYGLLSVTCQYYTRPELLFSVRPDAFRPQPKVVSGVLRMPVAVERERLEIKDEKHFWSWMQAAFGQKRKTLANNWKGWCEPERTRHALGEMGLAPKVRAETLSLDQLGGLYHVLK
jgi:16S rRNA (adenine1518-N6/adenine1519-N6)-dimethyltransferase